MCGISGIFNLSKKAVQAEDIIGITRTLKHRGPDDEGYLLFSGNALIPAGSNETSPETWNSSFPYSPQISIQKQAPAFTGALGFRRLSILDLSSFGHQPMCNASAELWIIFNGEIYNYIELRDELKAKGYHFISDSDTEVLLNAYHAWGPECLGKLNGMWSFVIYDKRKNELFCCRDRFGVKPFYYFSDKDHFAFASEQKALVQLPFVKKEINPAAVFDLFAFGRYESEQEGFFKNILELEPAHFMTINLDSKKIQKEKYFHLQSNESFEKFDELKFKDHCEHIRQLVFDSVKIRLRSDVPVGSCLSGGIDSSAIVCAIQELLSKNKMDQVGARQKLFTAGFDQSIYDESKWAKIVADQTGAEWFRTEPVKSEFLHDLETLAWCQDLPLASVSTYAQFKVMELAKKSGVKVVMDGQGGDEIFAGYPHHSTAFLKELWKRKQYETFYKEISSGEALSSIKKITKDELLDFIPNKFLSSFNRLYFEEQNYLNPDFYRKYEHRFLKEPKSPDFLNQALRNDITNSTLKHYLKCEDRSSMWFSIESRTPFSDDINLINYLFSVPSVYKIHNGNSKYLLREAFKGILPEPVRMRKDKKGFSTPNNEWISELKEEFRAYFTPDLEEYLDVKKTLKNYDSFFDLKNKPENYRIFKFIGFAVWKKVFQL